MMYHKPTGYVIAVLSNGKVLREQNGTVYLPFDSEYTIRVKNTDHCRVGVFIDVDGTSITNNDKIIIPPFDTFDLKRMIVDGDLTRGPALRFVSVENSNVQDPTESDNGIIRVSFYRETPTQAPLYRSPVLNDPAPADPYRVTYGSNTYVDTSDVLSRRMSVAAQAADRITISTSSCAPLKATSDVATSQLGATVPGTTTQQSFMHTEFDCSDIPDAVLTLQMLGTKAPVYVKDTRKGKCCTCAKVVKYTDNFCKYCGAKVNPIAMALKA